MTQSAVTRLVSDLKRRRQELGLSQEAVSLKIGGGKDLVCRLETGKQPKRPPLELLEEYAKAVGMEITATVVVRE